MTKAVVNQIFQILSKANPNPTTELVYTTDFTLLVAVILSAQATDVSVNKATQELFVQYNTPSKILALGEENLKKCIKTIGLYNSKARHIIALCKELIERHHGHIPNTFEMLIRLPGIGRKTANVLLNVLFQKPVIAVDTHVFRVAKRIGLAQGNSVAKVEKELEQIITPPWLMHAHHWLILHGRYICKARNPNCNICPIKAYCAYIKSASG
ncbi:endonuclease III [Candidatus Cardinium hertigii]|uniref:Endonuclease III n=1 Tax=Candidatus Cardinium hertigii TaxID=247481 RepID=A0A2Z3LCA4_9BACT|nr:endonuclease III [Candidatus Cardinium hertigii]AWN81802.1 Endonuclease III [Candidatus Cardinium hertigii]